MRFISLLSSVCSKFSWQMYRLALLFQILCKYCLSSSPVQKDKVKNKILQPFALVTPIQPPVLISFLNFGIAICVPFEPHIIFRFFEKACLAVSWPGHTSEHQCSPSAYLHGCRMCRHSASGGIINYNILSSHSPISAETPQLYTTINLLWCSGTEQIHVWFSLLGSCSLEVVK